MNTVRHIKQNGFSLIEVLIAVLVLSVGILAVSKLQTSLIRSGSTANHNSIAASIAQGKIDDLRRFVHLTTNADSVPNDWSIDMSPIELSYAHIANDEGGLIPPCELPDCDYSLGWTVTDYYYSDTINTQPTTTVTDNPAFKLVIVTVGWSDVGLDTNPNISFDTIIYRHAPGAIVESSEDGNGSAGPSDKIDDSFDSANTASIELEDDQVQVGGKVAPNISRKGASNITTFESILYNVDSKVERRDSFVTVGCVCTKTGATTHKEHLTASPVWDSVNNRLSDVVKKEAYDTVYTLLQEKKLGDIDQAFECNLCCRDGKTEIPTATPGDAYKVCRLKNVAGGLKIYPDWKLIGFNIIPKEFFNDPADPDPDPDNNAVYSSYVTNLIRTAAQHQFTEGSGSTDPTINTLFTVPDTEVASGDTMQLQARAIYIDAIPVEIYEYDAVNEAYGYTPGIPGSSAPTDVPLNRIPFYEVDLTKLAGWAPDQNNTPLIDDDDSAFTADDYYTGNGVELNAWAPGLHDSATEAPCAVATSNSINCVSNQRLIDKEEGTYSRGLFHANTIGSSTTDVQSQIFEGTNGWVDRNVNDEKVSTTIIPITVSPALN